MKSPNTLAVLKIKRKGSSSKRKNSKKKVGNKFVIEIQNRYKKSNKKKFKFFFNFKKFSILK